MLVFNKANIEAQSNCNDQWEWVKQQRQANEMEQRAWLETRGIVGAQNQAALIPRDAYRELDEITKRVVHSDEGRGYVLDLMGVSKSLDIGKSAYIYRRASDKTGRVERSLSGQVPESLSKTSYDYDGDPVPIFTTGYTRPWREERAFQTEGFDAMFDDQYNSMRDINEDIAIYLLWGDTSIKVQSYEGQGIANHRHTQKIDLGGSGANVNLSAVGTRSTAQAIVDFWTQDFAKELDDNYCMRVDTVWVSPQIRRRLGEPVSDTGEFKDVTLEEYLLKYGRIGRFETTFELGREGNGTGAYNVDTQARANQFFAYVKSQDQICPIVGQGISNIAIPTVKPMENAQNLIYSAMGLRIQADRNGRSKVFFASETS